MELCAPLIAPRGIIHQVARVLSRIGAVALSAISLSSCSSADDSLGVDDLELQSCPPIRAVQVNRDMDKVEVRAIRGDKVGRRLNTAPFAANPVTSPDGRWVAYESSDTHSDSIGLVNPRIDIVSVDGGTHRVLTHEEHRLVAWKGAGIVAKRWRIRGDTEALVVIDALTGSARTVWESAGRIDVVGWSGARAIAVTAVENRTEVWLIDVGTARASRRYETDATLVTPSNDLRNIAVVREHTPLVSAVFAGAFDGKLSEVPRTRPRAAIPLGWTADGWLLIHKNRRGPHDRVVAFRDGTERPVLTDTHPDSEEYQRLVDRISCSAIRGQS